MSPIDKQAAEYIFHLGRPIRSKEIPEIAKKAGIKNEADQFFIDFNLWKLRDQAAGYLAHSTEDEVKERLLALSKSAALKDVDFQKNWSFFALTEVSGSEPQSKLKMQWLKNGQVHGCIVDVWSKPPLYIVQFEDGRQEELTSVDAVIASLFKEKYLMLDRFEEQMQAEGEMEEIHLVEGYGERQTNSEDDEGFRKYTPEYIQAVLKLKATCRHEVKKPVVKQSFMTLRNGKKVYYRLELVSLRRYFPPAHKLPKNCR